MSDNPNVTIDPEPYVRELRARLDAKLTSELRRWTRHKDILSYAVQNGHRSRPLACMIGAGLVGGDEFSPQVLDLAVGLEMCHKSSLVRDDIVDEDESRSGRPTLHSAFGIPAALSASDVLLARGLQLIQAGAQETPNLFEQCLVAYEVTATGQLDDVSQPEDERAIDIAEMKSGAFVSYAFRAGASAVRAQGDELTKVGALGTALGTAFQILNDMHDLVPPTPSVPARQTDARLGRPNTVSSHIRGLARGLGLPDQVLRPRDDSSSSSVEIIDPTTMAFELAEPYFSSSRKILSSLQSSKARSACLAVSNAPTARRILF